jgi:hypothetical protein
MLQDPTVKGVLATWIHWLFKCSHPRTTFPRTIPAEPAVEGVPGPQAETYMACLDCGRHLAYDWETMRIATERRTPPVDRPTRHAKPVMHAWAGRASGSLKGEGAS